MGTHLHMVWVGIKETIAVTGALLVSLTPGMNFFMQVLWLLGENYLQWETNT
jgi:hypothetical protein